MNRVTREAGAEIDPQFIACIGSASSLIIGKFIINGFKRTAVIDTGATGSFIAGNSEIVCKSDKLNLTNNIIIRTADRKSLSTTQSIKAIASPCSAKNIALEVNLFIIPNRDEIMGHELILGIDSIRALELIIEEQNGTMIAHIDKNVIAQECKMLAAMELQQEEDNICPFQSLLEEYQDIFAETASSLMDTSPMKINLATDFSIKARPRPHSKDDILEIDRQVTKLIENDIIENSESTFSANVHLVPKKNGTKRMVIDYRFLNDIAIKDHFPLPQINNMFRSLHGAAHFATLDCTEGFLQIAVDSNDRYKTAFVTDNGAFQYKRCPFGFTNSPAKFQRAMNDIFKDGLYKRCVVYIDDILVFGKTSTELHNNLKWVFDQCRSRTVKLKRSKCSFNQREVEFLGFKISFNRIAPVQGKYDPIGLIEPTKKTDVRAILGSFNHYARFIERYADKTEPIRKLTRDDVKFEWTKELTELVKQLKEELNQTTYETIADSYTPKHVTIFISPISMEVACYDDKDNLVGRTGAVFKDAEKNYTSTEQQLVAIVHAYNKFGPFLKGPVTFRTTDKSLLPALKMVQRPERVTRMILKLPPDARFDVELIPGRSELDQVISAEVCYDEIFYTDGACIRNGKTNCQASWAVLATINGKLSSSGLVEYSRLSNQIAELTAILKACEIALKEKLSNILIITDSKYAFGAIEKWITTWKANSWKDNRGKPVVNQDILKQIANCLDKINVKCLHVKGHATDLNNIRVDRMAKEVLEKTVHLCIIGFNNPLVNQTDDEEVNQIINNLDADATLQQKYTVQNGELYYVDSNLPINCRNRLFVPKQYRKLLLQVSHDDPLYGGHLGIKKTKSKLIAYYWPRMSKDIELYVESCLVCQQQKPSKQPKYGLLQPIKTSKVFEQIHVDIIGPIKESPRGNRYIITAIDAYSRYGFAKPVTQTKTNDVIKFLCDEIIKHHGPPIRMVSDNGVQFTSAEFKDFIKKLAIAHHKTCEYHPQSNGMDERLNGTLTKILKNYITPPARTDWDLKIQQAVYVYNTTRHESIKVSPYAVLYGFNPRSPLRALEPDTVCSNDDSDDANRHISIREFIDKNAESAREAQSKSYNAKRQPQDFALFDVVRAKVHGCPHGESAKLLPRWEAPCVITKIIRSGTEPVAVELINLSNSKRRRSAFQDIRHLKERDADETDEMLLPGDIILEADKDESNVQSVSAMLDADLTLNTNNTFNSNNTQVENNAYNANNVLNTNNSLNVDNSVNANNLLNENHTSITNTSDSTDPTPVSFNLVQSSTVSDNIPDVTRSTVTNQSTRDDNTEAITQLEIDANDMPLTSSVNVPVANRNVEPLVFDSFDEMLFPYIEGNGKDIVSFGKDSASIDEKSGQTVEDGDCDSIVAGNAICRTDPVRSATPADERGSGVLNAGFDKIHGSQIEIDNNNSTSTDNNNNNVGRSTIGPNTESSGNPTHQSARRGIAAHPVSSPEEHNRTGHTIDVTSTVTRVDEANCEHNPYVHVGDQIIETTTPLTPVPNVTAMPTTQTIDSDSNVQTANQPGKSQNTDNTRSKRLVRPPDRYKP